MIKIYQYGEVPNTEIFARENIAANVESVVAEIIANVRENGDRALFDYALKFDKAKLNALEVSQAPNPGDLLPAQRRSRRYS